MGGSAIFIYGSIILAPETPGGESEATLLKIITWFVLTFLLMIMGGIIASILRGSI